MTVMPNTPKERKALLRAPKISPNDMMTDVERAVAKAKRIKEHAEWRVEEIVRAVPHLEAKLTKWRDEFMKNPHYAMRWSHETFGQAAAFDVLSQCLVWLEHARKEQDEAFDAVKWVEELKREATEKVLRETTSTSQSTSPTSTLGDRCATAVWAKIAKGENLYF